MILKLGPLSLKCFQYHSTFGKHELENETSVFPHTTRAASASNEASRENLLIPQKTGAVRVRALALSTHTGDMRARHRLGTSRSRTQARHRVSEQQRVVSQTVPQVVSKKLSQTVSQVVSQTVPQVVSKKLSQTVSKVVSQTVPQVVSQTVPQVVSKKLSQTVSQVVSQSHISCGGVSPRDTPSVLPNTKAEQRRSSQWGAQWVAVGLGQSWCIDLWFSDAHVEGPDRATHPLTGGSRLISGAGGSTGTVTPWRAKRLQLNAGHSGRRTPRLAQGGHNSLKT
ncbi:hypothetical protein RRG08_025873 [Elysia crispata]|uniref:Uncharacterized protein n=1 Tax=Elysia crispata TaxID=231223 RepID=A0AAE1DJW7_9GAST|nr:hypothetical protein RRG08_025873 [Elysia crispata]